MKEPFSVRALYISLRIVSTINKFIGSLFNQNYDFVLCYHDVCNDGWEFSVSREQFKSHIETLKRYVDIVSLRDLLNSRSGLKKPRAAITFDDGYVGVYKNAHPVLSKYRISATVFILGKNNINPKSTYKSDFLNKTQIKELVNAGWEVGFHTTSHNDLSRLVDAELEKEINEGKRNLEKSLGIKFKYFAYPFGKFSKKALNTAQASGFEAAFTVCGNKVSNLEGKKYELNRITVSKYLSQEDLKTLITPLGIFVNRIFTYLCGVKDNFGEYKYE